MVLRSGEFPAQSMMLFFIFLSKPSPSFWCVTGRLLEELGGSKPLHPGGELLLQNLYVAVTIH
jgi:hypothetical protein